MLPSLGTSCPPCHFSVLLPPFLLFLVGADFPAAGLGVLSNEVSLNQLGLENDPQTMQGKAGQVH